MADNIRIALVHTSINGLGGSNTHLMNLYRNLGREKFKVFAFCCSNTEDELRDFLIAKGIKREDFVLVSRWKKLTGLPLIIELARFLLDKKIDIIHSAQIQSDIFAVLAAGLAGVKPVFSLFESTPIPDNVWAIKRMLYRLVNKLIKKRITKTVTVSKELKEELISKRFRPAERIEVIHIGFEIPEKYKNHQPLFAKLKERRPLIGSMTRLSKEKGIDRFISAMPFILKKVPQAEFVITSKGPEEEELKKQVQHLGLRSKVTFTGWVKDVFSAMESIDIFVMPSLREGCPITLFEAMALSRPIVASKVKSISEIIDDRKEGLLVDTSDPCLFADKVLYLCDNPEEAIYIGKKGYLKVSSKFTIDNEVAKLKQLYLNSYSKN